MTTDSVRIKREWRERVARKEAKKARKSSKARKRRASPKK